MQSVEQLGEGSSVETHQSSERLFQKKTDFEKEKIDQENEVKKNGLQELG